MKNLFSIAIILLALANHDNTVFARDLNGITPIYRQDDIDRYFHLLGAINNPNQARGASCLGSYGLFVGMGLRQNKLQEASGIVDENLGINSVSQNQASLVMPTFSLAKGLPIPLDFSITLGRISENAQQGAIQAQLTLFQALNWPALAVRAASGRIMGIAGTTFSTDSISFAVSYSFLRYFTLYTEGLQYSNQGHITPVTKNQYTYLALTQMSPFADTDYQSNWHAVGYSYGIELNLFSASLYISLQAEKYGDEPQSQAAQLTLML